MGRVNLPAYPAEPRLTDSATQLIAAVSQSEDAGALLIGATLVTASSILERILDLSFFHALMSDFVASTCSADVPNAFRTENSLVACGSLTQEVVPVAVKALFCRCGVKLLSLSPLLHESFVVLEVVFEVFGLESDSGAVLDRVLEFVLRCCVEHLNDLSYTFSTVFVRIDDFGDLVLVVGTYRAFELCCCSQWSLR